MNPKLKQQIQDFINRVLSWIIGAKKTLPKIPVVIPDENLPPITPPAPVIPAETKPKLWWEIPNPSKNYGTYPENLQKVFQLKARQFAQVHGLNPQITLAYLATVDCESGWNPYAVNQNIVTKNGVSRVASTDYGICQVNDFYHIGDKLDFPNVDYVVNHPEEALEWMCKMFKQGLGKLWVCYDKNLYQRSEHINKFK